MDENIDTCCALMNALRKHMNDVKKREDDWKSSAMQARAISIVLQRELKCFRKASIEDGYNEKY